MDLIYNAIFDNELERENGAMPLWQTESDRLNLATRFDTDAPLNSKHIGRTGPLWLTAIQPQGKSIEALFMQFPRQSAKTVSSRQSPLQGFALKHVLPHFMPSFSRPLYIWPQVSWKDMHALWQFLNS